MHSCHGKSATVSQQFRPRLRRAETTPHSWSQPHLGVIKDDSTALAALGHSSCNQELSEALPALGMEALTSNSCVFNLPLSDEAEKFSTLGINQRKRRSSSLRSPAAPCHGSSTKSGHSNEMMLFPNGLIHLSKPRFEPDPRLLSYPTPHLQDEIDHLSSQGIARKRGRLRESNDGRAVPAQRVNHIHSERLRRRSMNHLFATVRSMLPIPTSTKTDKCTLISEIINYIHCLQRKVEQLQQKRAKLLAASKYHGSKLKTRLMDSTSISSRDASPDCRQGVVCVADNASRCSSASDQAISQPKNVPQVQLIFSERNVLIAMSSFKRPNMLSGVMCVLQDYQLDMINVNISTTESMVFHSIHAKMAGTSEVAKDDLQSALLCC